MKPDEFNRREFTQLTSAALGLVAGATLGCGDKPRGGTVAAAEKHLCRGLNDCKNQGAGGKNDCRGQGDCATVEKHSCSGENTCKGLGGCGATAGANDCKQKGGCHVPLMEGAWKTVRDRLEKKWHDADLEHGEAPPEKKE